jgi:hypothetical protein
MPGPMRDLCGFPNLIHYFITAQSQQTRLSLSRVLINLRFFIPLAPINILSLVLTSSFFPSFTYTSSCFVRFLTTFLPTYDRAHCHFHCRPSYSCRQSAVMVKTGNRVVMPKATQFYKSSWIYYPKGTFATYREWLDQKMMDWMDSFIYPLSDPTPPSPEFIPYCIPSSSWKPSRVMVWLDSVIEATTPTIPPFHAVKIDLKTILRTGTALLARSDTEAVAKLRDAFCMVLVAYAAENLCKPVHHRKPLYMRKSVYRRKAGHTRKGVSRRQWQAKVVADTAKMKRLTNRIKSAARAAKKHTNVDPDSSSVTSSTAAGATKHDQLSSTRRRQNQMAPACSMLMSSEHPAIQPLAAESDLQPRNETELDRARVSYSHPVYGVTVRN